MNRGSSGARIGRHLVADLELRPGREDDLRWSLVLCWYDEEGELRRQMIDEREGGLALARWLSQQLSDGVAAVARGETYASRYTEALGPEAGR